MTVSCTPTTSIDMITMMITLLMTGMIICPASDISLDNIIWRVDSEKYIMYLSNSATEGLRKW